MSMATLPPELTDHIIDFLHDDRKTLLSCSLVSKIWLPSSRYHLFGSLDIYSKERQDSLIRLLKNSPASTIPNHVHTFSIVTDQRSDIPNSFDTIAPYLDRLPVRSLTLKGHQWRPINKEHEKDVLKWFSGIRELETRLGFSCSEHFFRLISSFCSLEKLRMHIKGLRFRFDDLQPIRSFAFPPHLHTLVIGLDSERPLALSWLVSVTQFPPINTLDLYTITDVDEELPGVQALLQTLGPSIHSLVLWFECSIPDINSCIDLSHNTNLRSLRLKIDHDDPLYRPHSSVAKIFSQITSHPTEIELEVALRHFDDIYQIDWRQFEPVLFQPQFVGLRIVRIILRAVFLFDAEFRWGWLNEIRTSMSGLWRRDILDVIVKFAYSNTIFLI